MHAIFRRSSGDGSEYPWSIEHHWMASEDEDPMSSLSSSVDVATQSMYVVFQVDFVRSTYSSPHRIARVNVHTPVVGRLSLDYDYVFYSHRLGMLSSIAEVRHHYSQMANITLHVLTVWTGIQPLYGCLSCFGHKCRMDGLVLVAPAQERRLHTIPAKVFNTIYVP